MDQAIYREVLRTNLEILIEEACIEEVSRSYRGGVELLSRCLKEGFQGGEETQDECKHNTHQNKQSKSLLSIKHNFKSRCKAFLDQKHTKQV